MQRWIVVLGLALAGAAAWLVLREDPRTLTEDTAPAAGDDTHEPTEVRLLGGATSAESAQRPAEKSWPQGHASIEVITVDVQGTPIAGVRVALLHDPSKGRWARPFEVVVSARRQPHIAVHSETTDTDGRARFVGLDPSTTFLVEARPPAPFAPTATTAKPRSAWRRPLRITLQTGTPLTLQVVDAAGRGRAGTVRLKRQLSDGPGPDDWTSPMWATNATGRLTIARVSPGVYSADVLVPDYAHSKGLAVTVPADETLVLAVGDRDGGVLRGTVTDTSGTPLPDALVAVTISPRGVNQLVRVANSGPDGTYVVDGLFAGPMYGIRCECRGYAPVRSDYQAEVQLGSTHRLDFTMERGVVIRGVVRSASGDPIPHATVRALVQRRMTQQATCEADASGRYELDPLHHGPACLTPEADGFLASNEGDLSLVVAHGRPGCRVMLGSSPTQQIDLTMSRGTAYGGIVVDANGDPIAGAEVWLAGPGALLPRGIQQWTASDHAGRFVFTRLTEAPFFEILVRNGSRYAPGQIELPPGRDHRIRLPTRNQIHGEVAWTGEVPPGRQWVMAQSEIGAKLVKTHADVEADGQFAFLGLAAGQWTLLLQDAFRQPVGEPVRVQVEPDASVSVVLRPPALFSISGTLLNHEGRPHHGERMEARLEGGSPRKASAAVSADGRFRFTKLPSGTYELTSAVLANPAVANAGDSGLRLQSEPPFRFVGTVRLDDGSIPASVTFLVQTDRARTVVALGGNFVYESSTATNSVRVSMKRAEDDSGKRLSVRTYVATFKRGEPIAIVLKRGRRATVTVVDPDGAPVPGAIVNVFDPSSGHMTQSPNFGLQTDAQGVVELTGLSDAIAHVNLQPPPAFARPNAVPLLRSQTELRIALRLGGSISGRMLDPQGVPVRGASIMFHSARGRGSAQTGVDGGFSVSGLPLSAKGTLTGALGGYKSKFSPVKREDVPVGARGVLLQFRASGSISGRVVDPNGAPVRTTVWAVLAIANGGMTKGQARTQVDGTFSLGPLDAGVTYGISARATDGWLGSDSQQVAAPATNIELVLNDGLAVSGRLVGEHTAGLTVKFSRASEAGPAPVGDARSKADGTFRLRTRHTSAGTLHVRDMKRERYALLEDVTAPRADVELVLHPALAISGTIEGLIDGARNISVWASSGVFSVAVVVRDGATFRIPCLAPGTYDLTLTVKSTQQSVTIQGIDAGATDVVFNLEPK